MTRSTKTSLNEEFDFQNVQCEDCELHLHTDSLLEFKKAQVVICNPLKLIHDFNQISEEIATVQDYLFGSFSTPDLYANFQNLSVSQVRVVALHSSPMDTSGSVHLNK